jgi:hypothetical protein
MYKIKTPCPLYRSCPPPPHCLAYPGTNYTQTSEHCSGPVKHQVVIGLAWPPDFLSLSRICAHQGWEKFFTERAKLGAASVFSKQKGAIRTTPQRDDRWCCLQLRTVYGPRVAVYSPWYGRRTSTTFFNQMLMTNVVHTMNDRWQAHKVRC